MQISRSIINIITKLQHFYCQFLFSLKKSLSLPCQASHLAVRPVPQNIGVTTQEGMREGGSGGWGAHKSLFSVIVLHYHPLPWPAPSLLLPAGPMAQLTQADGFELSFRQKRFLRVLHCCFRYV